MIYGADACLFKNRLGEMTLPRRYCARFKTSFSVTHSMGRGSRHAVTGPNRGEVEPCASKLLVVAEIDPLSRFKFCTYFISDSTFNIL
jgi:hypothetical protein